MPRLIRDNSLTLALAVLFLFSIVGQALTGFRVENQERIEHLQQALTFGAYLGSGAFLSALFENWESEFLQMSAYVVLTAYLYQRGSPESRDPDKPDNGHRPRHESLGRWLYAHSLGLVLFGLFLASFLFHWLNSARTATEEALQHHQPPPTALDYLFDPQLWFESFQNWQSEFLSTAVLVLLGVVLRERGSPESKKVDDPDSKTGD